ncbi:flagellar basal-body rod protein FlgG [Brachyspira hyodysenteriae]|nr:flagellar basal-body rod protein FlgG [Brachyspira hyodysenteriae]MCZ9874427.1 flagellar basal-body rod protein FlgG [Brachyspira hyodysenteriae]
MVRSLWTAASGMNGMQFKTDTIANNLANVNTIGYKKVRADFEDLIYQNLKIQGTPATEDTVTPVGLQTGLGVKSAATQKMFDQGSLQATGNKLDLALEGEGFFQVLMPDGSVSYTRDGSFKIDANGQLVTSNGYRLVPEIVFPENFLVEQISISREGVVSVKIGDENDPVEIGQITLHRFINQPGLLSIGDNLYKETIASGPAFEGEPGANGFPRIHSRFR